MKTKIAALLLGLCAPMLYGQVAPGTAGTPGRRTCPGDPAANLASSDCSFTIGLRIKSLVTGSITDQAVLGAVFYSTVAHVRNDPPEWGRGWTGFGDRVGSRYGQTLAKGLFEFGAGEVMGIDPRHVSYASDPRVKLPATTGRRIGHAFMDFLTVRRSSVDGSGSRLPNVPLFGGSAASAFVGDLWYPRSATTTSQIALRAGGSLATDLGMSFYTEFSPQIGRVLGAIFKRGKSSSTSSGTGTAPPKGSN